MLHTLFICLLLLLLFHIKLIQQFTYVSNSNNLEHTEKSLIYERFWFHSCVILGTLIYKKYISIFFVHLSIQNILLFSGFMFFLFHSLAFYISSDRHFFVIFARFQLISITHLGRSNRTWQPFFLLYLKRVFLFRRRRWWWWWCLSGDNFSLSSIYVEKVFEKTIKSFYSILATNYKHLNLTH